MTLARQTTQNENVVSDDTKRLSGTYSDYGRSETKPQRLRRAGRLGEPMAPGRPGSNVRF
jgi:hypothetical protein